MSCNGCRILRKGCSDDCILRQSLTGIENPNSQANATVFLSKFFGRAGLTSFLSSVPQSQRPALFKSLLYEACGRTINPVDGAVGLLGTGKWNLCQAAVDTVLRGGVPHPLSHGSSSNDTGQAASVESSRYNSNLFVNSRLFRSSRSDLNLLLGPSKRKARDDNQGATKKAVVNESTGVVNNLVHDFMSRGRANDEHCLRTASPASDKSETINSEEGCRDLKGIMTSKDQSDEPELLRLFL